MSSYNELIALINGCINRNGVQAITGRVLNGVLRAMVNQLGAGYAMGGVAHPTDDPGTPEAPVCYYASEVGTYTHFGNIQIVPGELALLCFDLTDGWFKETMYEGFESVQATIDGNVGTPAVNVTYVNGVLSFDFSNMKGNTGAAAGFGNVTAAVDGTIGTPGVSVQTDGPDTAKNIAFQFTGLKGETGVTSVIATVDNTSGTPQCAVSLNGQQLTLAFTGLKGAQGDTGSSVAYPFTIVNNLTTNDATQALSAAMGVQLESEVSQLEAKVTDLTDFAYNTSVNGIRYYDNQQWLDGTTKTTASRAGSTGRAAFYPIPCKKGQVFHISVGYFGWQQTQVVSAAVVDENYTILERFHPSGAANALDFQFTITADNAKYLLINSYNNGVDKNWYYTEPNGFISYLKKDLFRADSLVFNQYNKESKLTFSRSGSSVVVDFSTNPYIFSTGGKVFCLFPSDASTFQLTIPATNVCYVDAALVENSTFASPVYLSASDIKMASVSGAFDIKGKIVLALTTNASGVQSGLFNIGAIGHYYYDNLITGQKSVRSAFPDAPDYGNLILEKCPKFSTMMREKNKDVCVVFTGTSLTQGNRYTTEVSNPTECPPSLFANDLCGTIFRRLVKSWEGQKYRRYDHTDLTYTGTWEETDDAVVNGTSIWDDVTKRGLTKTTVSSGASVSIQVPTNAWQFNFIYRSDSEGGVCTVSITQGNGKMEVFNGTAWVEANGYQFSMLEPAATGTKGNTCYQRRLKMRCKNKASGGINSIGTAKTLTITKAADASRMNVVGFEWSPREFMFTLINGARRNYAWGKWNSSRNLEYFQDSDIWEFHPDLVVAEITVVNWNTDSNHDPLEYVNDTKTAYFNEYGTDAKSLYEKSNHYQDCEVIFYGDTFWTGTAADWDANGDAVFKTVASAATNAPAQYQSDENVGRVQNIFEIYDAVDRYMLSKDYIFIPVIRTFKAVAESFYGSYKKGFTTSGADGDTLTYDATHLNDNGAALWAHIIAPIFDAIIGLPAK